MKIALALSIYWLFFINFHSKIEGEYTSFQCGKIILKLNADSTFKTKYNHFDSDYSKIFEGHFLKVKDTIIIFEKKIIESKRFKKNRDKDKKVYEEIDTLQLTSRKIVVNKKMVTDTIYPKNEVMHKLFLLENGVLKTSSFYCGVLNSRIKTHWAIFEKKRNN